MASPPTLQILPWPRYLSTASMWAGPSEMWHVNEEADWRSARQNRAFSDRCHPSATSRFIQHGTMLPPQLASFPPATSRQEIKPKTPTTIPARFVSPTQDSTAIHPIQFAGHILEH
ncbi:hypothetical protein CCUS01_11895 [Colletotrichum cuscutae]|uniref:Uncharacterized protein n=1 Tax=Colletotrichum cuscutae TaxID=1209917 RepID=A0AAI9TY76_9PEZI|nr:hypothetical protein CCUS01_11895 [Colletotrichum cuscutae]